MIPSGWSSWGLPFQCIGKGQHYRFLWHHLCMTSKMVNSFCLTATYAHSISLNSCIKKLCTVFDLPALFVGSQFEQTPIVNKGIDTVDAGWHLCRYWWSSWCKDEVFKSDGAWDKFVTLRAGPEVVSGNFELGSMCFFCTGNLSKIAPFIAGSLW